MKTIYFYIIFICIGFISCNSEQDKKIDKIQREKELTDNIKKDFIKKYNVLSDWDTINFEYTYDRRIFFLDTSNNKYLMIEGEINDFDISNTGICNFTIIQGYYPAMYFITKCTNSESNSLRKVKSPKGVFIIKVNSINRAWFDLEVLDEEISQSFSSDFIVIDSLIDYKIIK